MKQINEVISYLLPTEEPLSANVFFIDSENTTFIYDVGSNEEARNEIAKIKKSKTIILSHFHQDHTANMQAITYNDLYVGDKTLKYFPDGIVVKERKVINENPRIEIISISSSHSKGSLCLLIDNTYFLTGDSLYTSSVKGRQAYNAQFLRETILTLKEIDFKYAVLSHDEQMIYAKEETIDDLEKYYSTRDKNNPYIYR